MSKFCGASFVQFEAPSKYPIPEWKQKKKRNSVVRACNFVSTHGPQCIADNYQLMSIALPPRLMQGKKGPSKTSSRTFEYGELYTYMVGMVQVIVSSFMNYYHTPKPRKNEAKQPEASQSTAVFLAGSLPQLSLPL